MAMSVSIENGDLIIRLPLGKPTRSKSSGKTLVVASSHGTLTTNLLYRGKHLMVNVNAFIDPKEKKWRQRVNMSLLKANGKLE